MDGIIKQMKDILVQSNAWDEYAGLKEVIENDE